MSNELKKIIFGSDARNKMYNGVRKLSDAVSVTMGPSGKNVVIERENSPPHLTKDGVTVAQAINLRDHYENLGAQIVKEAAQKTADIAGDGTTTATVLSHYIYAEGLRLMAAGFDQSSMCRGIVHAVDIVNAKLTAMSTATSSEQDIVHVGTISANGDAEIGKLLRDAFASVGHDGSITVDEARGFDTYLDITEGTQVDRGYLSPYFVTNQEMMTSELVNPLIFLSLKKITNIREILPVLEHAHEATRSLLVVADDVEGEALQGLVVNKLKGTLQVCVIKSPEFGDTRISAMEDLAALLGCSVYTPADFLTQKLDITKLGTCKKVIISKSMTTFVGTGTENSQVKERLENIRLNLLQPTITDLEKASCLRSISRLSSGVAVIRVGGSTEIEMRERKDRVDDALCATRAALEEGIVPGGGIALLRAANSLICNSNDKDFNVGIKIVKDACNQPIRQILLNSGAEPAVVLNKLKRLRGNAGYDARREQYGDMIEMGIIDPTKVVKSALQYAASAACNLLSVGCAIVSDDLPEIDAVQDIILNN